MIDWFTKEVAKGLQGLFLLNLDGTPGADTIKATANVWIATLKTLPHTWDEGRDTKRIQAAFMRLAANSTRWPAPKNFIDALPAIDPVLKIDSPKGRYTPESRAAVKNLLARLGSRTA